jgi:hypothetical protein
MFVKDRACPAERVNVRVGAMPSAPPEIAADPARLQIWTQAQQERVNEYKTRGWVPVTLRGCDAEASYVCSNWFPSLPSCSKMTTTP